MTALKITEIDPSTATPDLWRRYHTFRRARAVESDPDDPVVPDDVYEQAWREERDDQDWAYRDAIVEADGQIVATFGTEAPKPDTPNYANNGHMMFGSAAALGPWRRRGIGRAWLRHVLDWMPETGATSLMASTHEPDGHAFLTWLAGEPRQRLRYSRTDFRALDWGMIQRWVDEAAGRAPGYTLEIHTRRLPEDLWDEYCAAKTEQMRHIPRDGLDMGDWVFDADDQRDFYRLLDTYAADHNVIWVRDPGGRIVAITDVGYYPHQPRYVQQFFTGVHPDARGLGLGKWVKARMLQLAREAYGDRDIHWVRTDNATSNAPMLAINERLGFREYRVRGIYQAHRDQIAERLGR